METSFGFRNVAPGQKQPLVNEVFHRVAGRYDLMNDLMSGGLHRLWKDAMVAWLNPRPREDWHALDVAGGTGDIAFRIVEASRRRAHATILDINGSMLEVGRARAEKKGLSANLDFVEASAEDLPFADRTFDAYTIAFGIRNVPDIDRALREAFRVLKPGGRFLCLEFSKVNVPGLDTLYDAYSFTAIPAIGKVVTGEYYIPHLAHVSMEPPVAVANVTGDKVEVWAPVQSPGGTREDLAKTLGIPEDNVTVNVTLLGGGFGRKSKCDFVLEAALLSKTIGAPVKVQWTREDDLHHDCLHTVSVERIEAGAREFLAELEAMEKQLEAA